jgi:hypothetical protein
LELACHAGSSRIKYNGAVMARPKGVVIKGVRFRPGEVDWEDAHSTTRGRLPDFDAMREGNTFVGSKITSAGLMAKIGKYLLIVTEKDEALEEFDFTLIPLHAKIQIRYH